jgi:hypothetical protein
MLDAVSAESFKPSRNLYQLVANACGPSPSVQLSRMSSAALTARSYAS